MKTIEFDFNVPQEYTFKNKTDVYLSVTADLVPNNIINVYLLLNNSCEQLAEVKLTKLYKIIKSVAFWKFQALLNTTDNVILPPVQPKPASTYANAEENPECYMTEDERCIYRTGLMLNGYEMPTVSVQLFDNIPY